MSGPIAGDLTNTLRQNHTRSISIALHWTLHPEFFQVSPSAPRFTLTSWKTFGQTITYNYFIMQWETLMKNSIFYTTWAKPLLTTLLLARFGFGHRFGYLWPFSILNLKRCIKLKTFWSIHIQLSVSGFSFSSYQLWHSTSLPLIAGIITHQLLVSASKEAFSSPLATVQKIPYQKKYCFAKIVIVIVVELTAEQTFRKK